MQKFLIVTCVAACASHGQFSSSSTDAGTSGSNSGSDSGSSGSNAGSDGSGSGSATPPPIAPNIAFLTSTSYTIATLGGLAGADTACNARAAAAHLAGNYVAWLSDSNANASARLGSASGWVRVDGQPIANSIADLVSSNIWYPLDVDELGAVDVDVQVWTGTDSGSAALTCNDWTDATAGVVAGIQASGGHTWTNAGGASCGGELPVYCFGTDRAATVAITPPAMSRLAFMTKATFAASGGLAGADALCASEASNAGRAGTFAAYLSTSTQAAIARFDATKPAWVRADGVPIGDLSDYQNNWIGMPIFAADGTSVGNVTYWGRPGPYLWASTLTCNDWSSSDASVQGVTSVDFDAGYGQQLCNATEHLLCLEQ